MHVIVTIVSLLALATNVFAAVPQFGSNADRYVNIPEDTPIGTVIKTFNVTDPDPGESIHISISNPTTIDYVNVNQTQGCPIQVWVILNRGLDRDRGITHVRLYFEATDKETNKVEMHFELYFDDVNDEKPEFQNEPYRLEIKENHSPGQVVYHRISASDRDTGYNGYVTYSMEADSQSDQTAAEYNQTFSIANITGNVTLLKTLDYETNSYYQFNVTAQDMAPPYHRVYTLLIVRILDVQDTPPFFTGIPYRTNIQENIPVGSSVMSVSATDGDPSVSNIVEFRILDGDCSSFFNISVTGEIVTAKPVDRDGGEIKSKSGVCSFPVEAYEINGTSPQYGNTTTTTNVTIIIDDENDNSPRFVNDTVTFMAEIQENTPENVPITLTNPRTMDIYDEDQGSNSEMTISLNTTDFSVSPSTVKAYGSMLIRVQNKTVLDYEERRNITFEVIATETANSSHVATATVILNLIDMNDNNPLFDQASYTFYIDENSPNRTTVGTIAATDKDSGVFGNVVFSLSGGNNQFVIDPTNGNIYTDCATSDLDREKLDVYYLSVTATDGGGRSNATSVVIHLNDTNDNPPRFQRQEYTASIYENNDQYLTKPIITLTATDADKENTNNSDVHYSILNISEPSVNLTINETNGEVYFLSSVDYELFENNTGVPGQVLVVVKARDYGEPVQSMNVTLKLDIQDENDNSPIFSEKIFNGTIFENETSTVNNHTVVLKVNATDADKTQRNSRFDYFIISGSFEQFSISSSPGEVYITPNVRLDRETRDFYNITITAIDHGSPPQTGTAYVYVTIRDVNDVLPQFNASSFSVSVKENQTTTDAITCAAFDVDEDHLLQFNITGIIAYSETGQVNASLVENYFSINSTTGSVTVHDSADREVAQEYNIQITVRDLNAYDPYPQTATTTLTLYLQDINDNYPDFDDKNYTFSISENALKDSIITTIHATDKDVNRTISYSLVDGQDPTSSFGIGVANGELRKVGPLDRETNASVEIQINATDSGVPPLSTIQKVLIVVTDFNDNFPIFTPHNVTYYVAENERNGTVIATINATDADAGVNSEITYSLQDGASTPFTIESGNGVIWLYGQLNREDASRYRLTVIAKDNPASISEQKVNQTNIVIVVTDINDCAPEFSRAMYNNSVPEDIQLNSLVIQTTATDDDQAHTNNSKVMYKIIRGNNDNLFEIDSETGGIYNKEILRGHVGNYTLTVMAKDLGDPQLNGTALANIAITDKNDNNPVIVGKPASNTVKTYECARVNSTVYHFNATDADFGMNAKLNFVISKLGSNETVTNFWIDRETGVFRTKTLLTDTGGKVYQLQLVVSDSGDPVLSSQPYLFNVEILDVNDHPPLFVETSYNMTVSENKPNATVGKVTAIDQDRNSVSCFTIAPPWSDDFVVFNNGTIVTTTGFDRENISSLILHVTVEDCSAPENKSNVCDNYTTTTDSGRQQTVVDVTILDVDDNPPVFTDKEIQVGMRRNVKQGSLLNLQLKEGSYVTDKDTPPNGKNKWIFKNNGKITLGKDFEGELKDAGNSAPCADNITHLFCISMNGSVTNNYWFSDSMKGFLWVPIIVLDGAGNDTATLKIYLIADSQVLLMTVFGRKVQVANQKDEILKLFSDITGHWFVYDDIADHKKVDGTVDSLWTDLFFHVVNSETNRIMSSTEAQRLVDQFSNKLNLARDKYKISQIVSIQGPGPETPSSEKTIYILVAAVVVLALTLCITVYLFCSSIGRYKRKLKAATISTDKDMQMTETRFEIPGSNQFSKQNNPLLNAEETKLPQYDSLSLSSENSLDANAVDIAPSETVYDTMEEKEMTMDLYNDDERVAIPTEDPLSAALRLHELRRSAENLERQSLASMVDSEDGLVKMNGDVSHEKVTIHGFENAAFDNLEHSEI